MRRPSWNEFGSRADDRGTTRRGIAGATLAALLAIAFGCGEAGSASAGGDQHAQSERDGGHDKKHDGDKKKHDREGGSKADRSREVTYFLTTHGDGRIVPFVGITADGSLVSSILQGVPDTYTLREGRCVTPVAGGGYLLVDAHDTATQILRLGPLADDGTVAFKSVFLQNDAANPAMRHTYQVAIAPDGSVYCSNQDTDTVTRYAGLSASNPGAPLPPPPSLAKLDSPAPGLFLPSEKMHKGGLHEVRGIVFGPDGLLYVADRDRPEVAAYDPATGERKRILLSSENKLGHPIQIVFTPDGKRMFVSDNGRDCVWAVDLASGAASVFVPEHANGLKEVSALLVDGDRLLVAGRGNRAILSVSLADGTIASEPFVKDLKDDPEFLLRVR